MEVNTKKQIVILMSEEEAHQIVRAMRRSGFDGDTEGVLMPFIAQLQNGLDDITLDEPRRPFAATEETKRAKKAAKRVKVELNHTDGATSKCDICGKEFAARSINIHRAKMHPGAASAE